MKQSEQRTMKLFRALYCLSFFIPIAVIWPLSYVHPHHAFYKAVMYYKIYIIMLSSFIHPL